MVPGPVGLEIISRRKNETPSHGDSPNHQAELPDESEMDFEVRMFDTAIRILLVLLLIPLLCWAASNFVQNAYNDHLRQEHYGK